VARRGFRQFLASLVVVMLASVVALIRPADAQVACPVSPADLAVDQEEQELLTLINQYRGSLGRAPLTMDQSTTRAAAWFSRDMATKNYFPPNHVDSNGRGIPERLSWCGVSYVNWAENIYAGSPDAQDVFNWWRTSDVHNTNMLRAEVTLAGIARANNPSSLYGWYWTLDLTSPGPASPSTGIVVGSTWYSDGTRSKSGPVGTTITAHAVNAQANIPYRLVLGTGTSDKACQTIVQVLNQATLFTSPAGRIGQVTGTVQPGIPPGTYKLCFEDSSSANLTGTGGAIFTVVG